MGEELILAGATGVSGDGYPVGEKLQRSAGRHVRVELPQRTGGGVARVGEHGAAGGQLLFVEPAESGVFHEHLAADLEQASDRAMQAEGDGSDGPELGGDFLPHHSVPPGRSLDQQTVAVDQFNGQTVEFRFDDVGRSLGLVEKTQQSLLKGQDIGVGKGILQAEHGQAMPDLEKPSRGGAPTRRLGESSLTSSGCRASRSSSS